MAFRTGRCVRRQSQQSLATGARTWAVLSSPLQGSNANGTLGTNDIPMGAYSSVPVPLYGGAAWVVVKSGPTSACGAQVDGSGAYAAAIYTARGATWAIWLSRQPVACWQTGGAEEAVGIDSTRLLPCSPFHSVVLGRRGWPSAIQDQPLRHRRRRMGGRRGSLQHGVRLQQRQQLCTRYAHRVLVLMRPPA